MINDNGWIPSTRDTHLKEDPERLYYLHDELGSTTKVIGENGKTSAHYNYDEFGRPLSSRKFDQNWPGPDNTFGYTGYQYDVSSDLYYAQARYYNAEIGRFISEDPWKGTIVEPNTMNPYPYVLNNPLKYVDPLGLRNMAEGGSGATNTPTPIINTKPKQNVVNQVKEEVVKKETSGASDWSCKVANDGTNKKKYIGDTEADFRWSRYYQANIHNPNRLTHDEFLEQNSNLVRTKDEYIQTRIDQSMTIGSLYVTAYTIASFVSEAKFWLGNRQQISSSERTSKSVDNFIKSNVNENFQQNVKNAFTSDAKVTTLTEDVTVYRYHGGTSSGKSYWYTPNQTSNPGADLALPSGNTYKYMDTYVIPKGTTILEGTVAPNFGQPGGGYQFYVPNPTVVVPK